MTPIPYTRDLVLVGGGHSHALVLKHFGMNPVPGLRLTVINPGPTAPYTGMLPGHVAGHYDRDALEIDLYRLARFAGARLLVDTARGLDLAAREIHLASGRRIAYDAASLDIGVTSALPELPGFSDHGVPAKPLGPLAARWRAFLDDGGGPAAAVVSPVSSCPSPWPTGCAASGATRQSPSSNATARSPTSPPAPRDACASGSAARASRCAKASRWRDSPPTRSSFRAERRSPPPSPSRPQARARIPGSPKPASTFRSDTSPSTATSQAPTRPSSPPAIAPTSPSPPAPRPGSTPSAPPRFSRPTSPRRWPAGRAASSALSATTSSSSRSGKRTRSPKRPA